MKQGAVSLFLLTLLTLTLTSADHTLDQEEEEVGRGRRGKEQQQQEEGEGEGEGEGSGRRYRRSDDVDAWQAVTDQLALQLIHTSALTTALQNRVGQLQAKFDASQKSVAFLARHSRDPFSVAPSGTLVYDHADYNLGAAYDPATGFFTAPVAGLYVFQLSCMSADSTGDEDIGVLVDGSEKCRCYSYSKEVPAMGSSGLATVHMDAGQRAWVRLNRGEARNVRGYLYNTFAGFLVRADV